MAKKTTKPTRSRKPTAVAKHRRAVVATEREITDKMYKFAQMYFVCDLNGTDAALATFDCSSREVAASVASEYLRKPEVRALIDARLDEYHLSANEVLARLAFHARGSMEDFIDADSMTIDLKKAKAAKRLGLIKKFKTKFTTTTKTDKDGNTEDIEVSEIELELYDAQSALVHIGKYHSLWNDGNTTNINFNNLTDEQLEQLASGKPVKTISVEAGK